MNSASRLFTPVKFGHFTAKHRVVLAPLTRLRSGKKSHVPNTDLVAEYYAQRASTPGTLLISEGTIIAPKAGGFDHIPGIWSDEQVASWKKVTDRVHQNGSFIFVQIAALGRNAMPFILDEEGFDLVSSSPVPLKPIEDETVKKLAGNQEIDQKIPRELTKEEIKEYYQLFVTAAKRAMEAGFDGVELHGATGFLIDQFLQDVVNQRTDEYGGSIENRSRFALELIQAVSDTIGEERVALRLSPWSTVQSMGMKDPIPQFSHLIAQLTRHHPDLAYIHAVEARVSGSDDIVSVDTLDFLRDIWRKTGRPFLSAGGYTPKSALEHVEKAGYENEMVVFGRHFIANPDLPKRILKNIPLNPYDRSTFYLPEAAKGYTDYPFAEVEA